MTRLKIRLFGGFQAYWCDDIIDSFESQKVRGLCAYLAHAQRRACSRDSLAGLFWPNNTSDSARRNLRQALYSLRRAIGDRAGEPFPALRVAQQSIQLQPGAKIWIDTEEFHEHLRLAQHAAGDAALANLASAVQLYTGDFLAGFHVKDCPAFEEWWLLEQAHLRDSAAGALRTLVERHLEEGSYSLGVKYARQLLKIDPFSEDAHRSLMRLHALSGRRGRALAVYLDLCRVLMDELGVVPSEETTSDYQAILEERLPGPAVLEKVKISGPMIPMVGRRDAVKQLRQSWEAVRSGRGRFSLVTGEQGVGKTRLLRFTLHEATGRSPAVVLRGRYPEFELPICFAGLREAITNAVLHEPELAERVLSGMTPEALTTLCRLVPQLRDLQPGLPLAAGRPDLGRMASALATFLQQISLPADASEPPEPVILLLDDLQWADGASLQVLAALVEKIHEHPIWIVGTARDEDGPLEELTSADHSEVIRLHRLSEDSTKEIANALLGPDQSGDLVLLLRNSEGLPLRITEVVNLLWDRHVLQAGSDGVLRLGDLTPELEWMTRDQPPPLGEIIAQRVEVLPCSTRRLLTLAAIVGDGFDAEFLNSAEGEHEGVIEIGLQVLLEHWLIRHILGYWADTRRDRDIALWSSGPSKGTFEFIHVTVQRELYRQLSSERRRILHGRVASALEQRQGRDDDRLPALLAHHHSKAGAWWAAARHFRNAAETARNLGAKEAAARYLEAGLAALEQAADLKEALSPQDVQSRRRARTDMVRELESLRQGSPPPAAVSSSENLQPSA